MMKTVGMESAAFVVLPTLYLTLSRCPSITHTKMSTSKVINTYQNSDGVLVTVYAEKKVKRIPWQRGEAYLGMKVRIPEDGNRLIVPFSRKNGKY